VLNFIIGDHLDSSSLTTDADGNELASMLYTAWGETRLATGSMNTDYQYTGQRTVAEIGLHFYNARWYDPSLGRFAQADMIVPSTQGVQGFDRYAYVNNSPVMYTDPTGHLSCKDANAAPGDCTNKSVEEHYGIRFAGNWTHEAKQAVFAALRKVGLAFANEIGGDPGDAFREVYGLNDGDTFLFEWDENCWGCREDPKGCDAGTTTGDACVAGFGYTNTENWIEFASMSNLENPLRNINNVIHELGHALNLRLGRIPENSLAPRQDLLVNGAGFYGSPNNRTWEASSGTNASETFADQFLGWVYGQWGEHPLGPVRAEFMNQMNGTNGWVSQSAGLP
jgi:RHS repeat-associated protein